MKCVVAERAYMLEVLAEFIAEVRARFMEEIEAAYGKNFNMVRLDFDALLHEIRKFAGAGVIENRNERIELGDQDLPDVFRSTPNTGH